MDNNGPLRSRTSTYHPEEFPVTIDFLQTTTSLSIQKGTRTIYVNSTEQQCFADAWTGKTLYPFTQAGAKHYGLHYIGDLTNKLEVRQLMARAASRPRPVWFRKGSLTPTC